MLLNGIVKGMESVMHDIECPYCGHEQEVNHDDGHGYAENELHEQQCGECYKTFVFTTYISYSYEPYKADCLNDGEHDFKATSTYPKECTRMRCSQCNKERNPTDEEWKVILAK